MQSANSRAQNQNVKPKVLLKPRCYQFSLNLIKFIDTLPNHRSHWIIADQLLRSGTSIGANVTEASAASSKLEFKKFFEIALKSANETIYWLNMIKDSRRASVNDTVILIEEVTETSQMLGASILTLKGKTTIKQT